MSRIDDLLARLAPDGVPFVPLGDVGTWRSGITPSKQEKRYWTAGDVPWLASMDVTSSEIRHIRGRVTEAALDETSLKIVRAPAVVVVARSNILRKRLPVGLLTEDAAINQDVRALVPRASISAAYVFQALRAASERIRSTCVRTDGSMAAVDSRLFFQYRIPVPPLEVQVEIVRILDSFQELEAELEAELESGAGSSPHPVHPLPRRPAHVHR